MARRLILEVGNSSLKFYDCAQKKLRRFVWEGADVHTELADAISNFDEYMVFGTHAEMLKKTLEVFDARHKKPLRPVKHPELLDSVYKIDELGVDRYLGLLGAINYLSEEGESYPPSVCILGAGTAWTFDFLQGSSLQSSPMRHTGGCIALSPEENLVALSEKTGGLPDYSLKTREWDWSNPPSSWASTYGAISGALKAQFTGLLRELLPASGSKESPIVLVHGGAAAMATEVLKTIDYPSVIVQELVFLGAEKLWHNDKVETY
jgi:pantothenate kinase type III